MGTHPDTQRHYGHKRALRVTPPEPTVYASIVSQHHLGEPFDPDDLVEPDGSASTEQVEYGEATHSVLTPIGQIESYGNVARGLGPRRVKIIIAVIGIGLVAVTLMSEL